MKREQIRTILSAKKAGIAGAGGLGSNSAVALARAGVGMILAADFDTVAESNLDRQHFFKHHIGMKKVEALADVIDSIGMNTIVEKFDIQLDPDSVVSIFGKCDIIIEAFDSAEAKRMIIETVQSRLPDIPIISYSGLSGWGHPERLKIFRSGNLMIAGEFGDDVDSEHPPMAPKVFTASGIEADLALEILLASDTDRT